MPETRAYQPEAELGSKITKLKSLSITRNYDTLASGLSKWPIGAFVPMYESS